jgi:hypothetical protein
MIKLGNWLKPKSSTLIPQFESGSFVVKLKEAIGSPNLWDFGWVCDGVGGSYCTHRQSQITISFNNIQEFPFICKPYYYSFDDREKEYLTEVLKRLHTCLANGFNSREVERRRTVKKELSKLL